MQLTKKNSEKKKKKKKKKVNRRRYLHDDWAIGYTNMQEAIRLPKDTNVNEWIAMYTTDMYNEISLLFGVVREFCTKQSCPVMCAGSKYEYLWNNIKTNVITFHNIILVTGYMKECKLEPPLEIIDMINKYCEYSTIRTIIILKHEKMQKCSAIKYIDLLLSWTDKQISKQTIFPFENEFPENIKQIVKIIFKRLFRIYAHIYHHHMAKIVQLDCEAHLNTCFKHFVLFVREYKLVRDKELAPLANTINDMMEKETKKPKYKPKYRYS